MISIIHQPNLKPGYTIDPRVDLSNPNYFGVTWDDSFPRPSNSCADSLCTVVDDACMCDVNIVEDSVFSSIPTAEEVVSQLYIGSVNPTILGNYIQVPSAGDVEVWHIGGGFSRDTVFGVTHRDEKIYVKNIRSTVEIASAPQYHFRNPPHHLNIAVRESRDAIWETDAVLKTFFHHQNLAPFLALRIIQRFGISNPSNRYIKAVSTAFKNGAYASNGHTFGEGKYGDLSAMVAAIVLDREASTVVLDADPTSGSLKEPMIKLIAFMRAMGYQNRNDAGLEVRFDKLQNKIGQEPHSAPGVFSFFLPEYSSPGHIKSASLTAPEAQLLSGPKIIGLLNGIISMVDLGLTECFGGFAQRNLWNCDRLAPNQYYDTDDDRYTMGKLTFTPSNPNDATIVVDELSLLLTGGRLNSESRSIIASAYQSAGNSVDGLRIAQKLMVSTPEYQSTNVFYSQSERRADVEFPPPSEKRYKAVLFLKFDGGMDSFNMLVPHSGCSGGKSKSSNELCRWNNVFARAML